MRFEELRHTWRSLRRAPGLTVISVMTVALGVGAGTALFSVVKAVLLNPLPYPDPNQLAWVAAIVDGQETRASLPDFDDWRAQNHSFTGLTAFSEAPIVAGGGSAPERTSGAIVSEDFFDVIGVQPSLGRALAPEDHGSKTPLSAVVLGYGLWQRAYGGDPAILGRSITVLGRPSAVVGVMPPGFSFPAGSELWVSARALNDGNVRTAHNYWVVGRLRPGARIDMAGDDIRAIAKRLKQEYPGPYQTEDARAALLASHLLGSVRTPLLILLGAVGLLVLVVCVNVANLLLVRVSDRARELAVRTALGAEPRDLFRHLLAESLILATAGGVCGVAIAFASVNALRVMLPASVPRAADAQIDAGVLAFTLALTAAVGVLFGVLPSWRGAKPDIHETLKAGARGQTATPWSRRTQAALVVSEVALSLMLLAGAGLLMSSFARLRAVDPGFSPTAVLTMNVSFPITREELGRFVSRYRDLLDRVRALPGVESAGTIKDLPLDPIQRRGHFFIEHQSNVAAAEAGYLVVTPGLMEALRIPVVNGRGLADGDSDNAPGAVVINAEMARRFFSNRDPIGQRIWFNSFEPKEHWLEIVGVAGDVRQEGLIVPVAPLAYINYAQVQIKAHLGTGNLIVRALVDPSSLIPAVRKALREVQPEAAASFRTMDDVMAGATSRQRFQMQVLAAFAALALVLAAVGLYGVLSHTVTSNRNAIGIRLALGAQPADVFRMVERRALGLTATGAAVGLLGCLAARSVLERVLYGIGPSDPAVLAAAVASMLATAGAACWFPARRAMKMDPLAALRDE